MSIGIPADSKRPPGGRPYTDVGTKLDNVQAPPPNFTLQPNRYKAKVYVQHPVAIIPNASHRNGKRAFIAW